METSEYFKEIRELLIQELDISLNGKKEENLYPHDKALRKFFYTFPLPVVIAKTATFDKETLNTIHLIVYDFSQDNQETVDGGTINFLDEEIEKLVNNHISGQIKILNINENVRSIHDSAKGYFIGFFDYDIYNNKRRFKNDLWMDLTLDFPNMYISEFDDSFDFNTEYSLTPDEILSEKKFLKVDTTTSLIPIIIDDEITEATIENFQKEVAHIQLIPQVPDEVKHIFNLAKKIYIFRYYDYHFGKVSTHYANLAFESAMKNYYNQWLGEEAHLKNKKGAIKIIKPPNIRKIEDFVWKNAGWNKNNLVVNSELYPYSMKKLAVWILEKKNLSKHHIYQLDHFILMRNILSHPVTLSIFPGNSEHLEKVAFYINLIFHEKI